MQVKKLEKSLPLYKQIYDNIRHSIDSNELKPGSRIPSSKELSVRFGAAAKTVQIAMSALAKEGLIERQQRLGSFVRGKQPRLSRIGIYCDVNFWNYSGMDYCRLLYGKLQTILEEERISYRLFQGRHDKEHFPKDLITAARNFEIQALLTPLVSHLSKSAFEELGIPVINPGAVNRSCGYDLKMMFSLACNHLAKKGCRSAGFITSTANWDTWVIDEFKVAAGKAGLLVDDQWIEHPSTWTVAWEMEEFGYRSFCNLKGRGQLPEGLLVYPDTVARGVVTGILDKRVDVPTDLKLVMHGNEGLSFFKPFPAATVLASPTQEAATMIDLARRKVAGENPELVLLPFKLLES